MERNHDYVEQAWRIVDPILKQATPANVNSWNELMGVIASKSAALAAAR